MLFHSHPPSSLCGSIAPGVEQQKEEEPPLQRRHRKRLYGVRYNTYT